MKMGIKTFIICKSRSNVFPYYWQVESYWNPSLCDKYIYFCIDRTSKEIKFGSQFVSISYCETETIIFSILAFSYENKILIILFNIIYLLQLTIKIEKRSRSKFNFDYIFQHNSHNRNLIVIQCLMVWNKIQFRVCFIGFHVIYIYYCEKIKLISSLFKLT